jgi:uncharacterized Zn finger protein
VFELSYLASTHRKRQSHDRLEFRSHATAAKTDMETSNRLGRGSLYLRRGSGLDGVTQGGKIDAFVASSPHQYTNM